MKGPAHRQRAISKQGDAKFPAQLLDCLFDGVYFVNAERKITYWNQGAEFLTGYPSAEVVGRHCYDNLLAHLDGAGHPLCDKGCPLSKSLGNGKNVEADVFLRHKSGHRVAVSVRVAPVRDCSGQICGAVEVFSDATAKVQAEKRARELEGMAFRDSLTSLSNRRYTEVKVKRMIEECFQFNRPAGLLMLDIDHFRRVNDSHGHDAGDQVLKAVASTLLRSLRKHDLVGCWGG